MVNRPGFTSQGMTLVSLLRQRAAEHFRDEAYRFVLNIDDEQVLSYGELDRRARAVAALLQETCSPGDRALLLCPPGFDYISAFFGCLYAGVIAVPAYPPRQNRSLGRLRAIVADAQATVALTTTPILSNVQPRLSETPALTSLRWVALDVVAPDLADGWAEPLIRPDMLAFLQYTAGSTGMPKGVMLSHANLLHNSAAIQRTFKTTRASKGVIWLPPYHDMGLIGGILQPIYVGCSSVLLSPVSFLQSPFLWLQTIARTRATTSGGPNFAYDLCVRSVTSDQRAQLDLSGWQVAFNGAEPVRAETMQQFAATFAECGFRPEAFYPCYGLAEATLLVAGGNVGQGPVVQAFDSKALEQNRAELVTTGDAQGRVLVASGATLPDQQLRIVNAETRVPCADDEIGELWVSGPSIALGYWNKPELTAATFQATLADSGAGPFLRTGDQGLLHDGQLYITGRIKDLIIIRGRNHYPQDIERTVEQSHPALRPGAGAAFSIDVAGEERLAVVQELQRTALRGDMAAIAAEIRRAVAEEHELQVHAVVLIRPASIPKTTSGKIQRHACRAAFLADQLEIVACHTLGQVPDEAQGERVEPGGSMQGQLALLSPTQQQTYAEQAIRQRLAGVLRVAPDQIDTRQPITALGLDSLAAVELKNRLELDWEQLVSLGTLLQGASIAELAASLLSGATTMPAAEEAMPAGAGAPGQLPPLTASPREEELPLAFLQERLWLFEQLMPGTPVYNIPVRLQLKGKLQPVLLAQALNEIVRRHEALRTIFSATGGRPAQRILPQLSIPLPMLELHLLDERARARALEEQARAAAGVVFDLSSGPLLYALLLRVQEDEYQLLLTFHHIIFDGWSLTLFLDELAALYTALSRGDGAPLPPLPLQYADFVGWQRRWLQGPALEERLRFWTGHLAGAPPTLELPTDYARPQTPSYRAAAETASLPQALVQALSQLAQQEGATLFMALLTALNITLARWARQDDIVIGTASANRDRLALEPMIGCCINFLPLRTRLDDQQTGRQLLRQLRATLLEAYSYQDCPFEAIVEAVNPPRQLNQTAIYNVGFLLQKYPQPVFDGGALAARLQVPPSPALALDLNVLAKEEAEGLALSCEYNPDLFEPATIARLLTRFQLLIEQLVRSPDKPVAAISLLTVEDHALVLPARAERAPAEPRSGVHDLIAEQAALRPAAQAVVFEGQSLSYEQLNQRANRLAHHLMRRGVGPGTRIGIAVERSPAQIVGLLAILKAGGTYVPLDPGYPSERLSLMIADAEIALLLTQEPLAASLPVAPAQLVLLDRDWPVIATESAENPRSKVSGATPAYIIYTSGSTGRPKGVVVPHHALAIYTHTARDLYAIQPEDRVLQFASVSFDASVEEIFPCLSAGATLVLRTEAMLSTIAHFLQGCRDQRISILDLPTAFWHELTLRLQQERLVLPPSLRLVILGGERALPERLAQWHELVSPDVRLVNTYGPTEATVVATAAELTSAGRAGVREREVAIGRPLQHVELYVLDPGLQPVPFGFTGELYIGGEGLASGYLNRPALTAERFSANPFSDSQGARLYRTGDLVRYRHDGELEYMGRCDDQVKIRGFRVELGEIEAQTRAHAGVEDVVVVAREDTPGEKQLVAYVVPQQELTQSWDLQQEHVSQWQTIYQNFEVSDIQDDSSQAAHFGWNSNITGQPFSEAEMSEWATTTVERILELKPQDVLEIGCGTGIILLRLAPATRSYVGIDFSDVSLRYLQQQVERHGLAQVRLAQGFAHDLAHHATASCDTIIINSVIQYFPSIHYLVDVLGEALRIVKPGGRIFIGDVRNLRLLEDYYTDVLVAHAPPEHSIALLRELVQQRMAQEEELVVDPDFFWALRQKFSQIAGVQIQPKRGRMHNELSKFRYDVTLQLGPAAPRFTASWLDWQKQELSLEAVRHLLEETRPACLGLTNIPNARLMQERYTRQLLARSDGPGQVEELCELLARGPAQHGVEPDDLWALGDAVGYRVALSTYPSHEYTISLILSRGDGPSPVVAPDDLAEGAPGDWSRYATMPLRGAFARKFIPQLRAGLEQRLPRYMLPHSIMLLERLPRSANGKLDRRALPAPAQDRPELQTTFVAPRTPIEELVSGIWQDVLGLEQVGIYDNFFDLGGHSLLATQVVSRLRDAFGVQLSLRSLFQDPTIAGVASVVEAQQLQLTAPDELAALLARLEEMPEEEAQRLLESYGVLPDDLVGVQS